MIKLSLELFFFIAFLFPMDFFSFENLSLNYNGESFTYKKTIFEIKYDTILCEK